jgi:hypothetical protein
LQTHPAGGKTKPQNNAVFGKPIDLEAQKYGMMYHLAMPL